MTTMMSEKTQSDYKRFDENRWREFGKTLLKKKGSAEQIDFLNACLKNDGEFFQFIAESLSDQTVGENEFAFDHPKFSELQFCRPPGSTQERIWDAFNKCNHETLSECGFWGYVIYRMLASNLIEPFYLAAGLGGNAKGAVVISEALDSKSNKKVDRCVRRILRSMCNPAPRGNRIVFYDFCLSQAYWRWYWAEKMSTVIQLSPEQIRGVLNLDYFQELSAQMHSGRSCISVKNVFGGLLLYLQTKSEKVTGKNLRAIVDKIAYLSAWKAIEAQSPEDNKNEIANLT